MEKEPKIEKGQDIEGKTLEDFRREIGATVEREKTEQKTAHFKEINVEELSMEDMALWEKIKDRSITLKDINDYKKGFYDDAEKMMVKENISVSRIEFAAFASNKASPIIINRQMNERKKISP